MLVSSFWDIYYNIIHLLNPKCKHLNNLYYIQTVVVLRTGYPCYVIPNAEENNCLHFHSRGGFIVPSAYKMIALSFVSAIIMPSRRKMIIVRRAFTSVAGCIYMTMVAQTLYIA